MKFRNLLICLLISLNWITVYPKPSGFPEGFCFDALQSDKQRKEEANSWFISAIESRQIQTTPQKYPIIIAIIDDGFNLSIPALKPFLYVNEKDLPNSFDDDANSYKDDYMGWDISDNDPDVNPPKDKLKVYYHGTYLSGIIIQVLKSCYGEKASDYFKILPIKAISDKERLTYIKDGYKAMDYAHAMHADIICCAWGSNVIKQEEKDILKKITDSGITVVASSGNFNNSLDYYPAAADKVLAIAATDSLNRKIKISNFGRFVDLTAPGENIAALSSSSDNELILQSGTSPATAIATAAAAIIKLNFPEKNIFEIEEILKATTNPIDSINTSYTGRLGAGALDFKNIIDVIEKKRKLDSFFNSKKQKGIISIQNRSKNDKEWEISPFGHNKGIEFKIEDLTKEPKNSVLKFTTSKNHTIEIQLNEWKKHRRFVIDDKSVKMQFIPKNVSKKFSAKISYEVLPNDSSTLFCGEKQYYTELTDTISDGSGISNYTNNCDCKWQITVPDGYRISLEFTDFDTEELTDNVFLFDGEYAIPQNAIARFSGSDIPPFVVSRTNKVLVWFVTDNKTTRKGWTLVYKAIKIQ